MHPPEYKKLVKRKRTKKGIRAWLITWKWFGDENAIADKVIAVLNPRWTRERVAPIVDAIYAMCSYSIEEMVMFTRRPERTPYRSEVSNGVIICGHNPWLEARKVSDLIVDVDEKSGLETIKWNLLPRYEIIDGDIRQVRGVVPEQFSRRIVGSPSNMTIYDRVKGTFKPGWGPGEIPKRTDQ